MMLFGWKRVEGVPLAWDLFQWRPWIEQVELFPARPVGGDEGVDRSDSNGYLDTEVSVSALEDGRTVYAF